jgi:hypothetical protein
MFENVPFIKDDIADIAAFYHALMAKCPTLPQPFILWMEADVVETLIVTTGHLHAAILLMAQDRSGIKFLAGRLNATVLKRVCDGRNPMVSPELVTLIAESAPAQTARAPVSPIRAIARHEEARSQLRTEIAGSMDGQEFHVPRDYPHRDQERVTLYKYTMPKNLGLVPVPVWEEYAPLMLSLNSMMYTMQKHLVPRGRYNPVDQDLVLEVCKKVMRAHSRGQIPVSSSDDDTPPEILGFHMDLDESDPE